MGITANWLLSTTPLSGMGRVSFWERHAGDTAGTLFAVDCKSPTNRSSDTREGRRKSRPPSPKNLAGAETHFSR
jgi:hypothetical protein